MNDGARSGRAPLWVRGDALGVLELSSIARGVVSLDQMVKRAVVHIAAARSISPGHYLIFVSGNVAEVEEAMDAGREAAADDLLDDLFLPDPADQLRAALASQLPRGRDESLAIVETRTISAGLWAAESAVKETGARLLELRLGAGLSGKAIFTLSSTLSMIEAARSCIEAAVPLDRILRIELIAQPHPDLPSDLLGAEEAFARGPA